MKSSTNPSETIVARVGRLEKVCVALRQSGAIGTRGHEWEGCIEDDMYGAAIVNPQMAIYVLTL